MSEPVAWMWTEHDGIGGSPITHFGESNPHWGIDAIPVYTEDVIREEYERGHKQGITDFYDAFVVKGSTPTTEVEQHIIERFLQRTGQYVTNDATRNTAIREAVEAEREACAQLKVVAEEVFDAHGPETPQVVRDVIEWFASSIRARGAA